jgi:hypothetical protein
MSGNAERRPQMGEICHRCLQSRIRNVLDQTGAEHRCRYAENDIVRSDRSGEIRLREVTVRRIRSPGDREEIMHAAIRRSVRIADEPRLANWAVQRDERRYGVGGAHQGRNRNLGIRQRPYAARGGLSMAAATAVEVEHGPEAAGEWDRVDIVEHPLGGGEEIELILTQSRKRTSGARRTTAQTGIGRL